MTLTIREGRTYVARNGEKFGPMRASKRSEFNAEWPWTVDGTKAWKSNGSYSDIRPVCEYDLVALWQDGPVVTETITKTRIVPGVYDRITVNDEGKAGMVGLWLNNGHYFSADELDAAAAVLSALAKGLRDA